MLLGMALKVTMTMIPTRLVSIPLLTVQYVILSKNWRRGLQVVSIAID